MRRISPPKTSCSVCFCRSFTLPIDVSLEHDLIAVRARADARFKVATDRELAAEEASRLACGPRLR